MEECLVLPVGEINLEARFIPGRRPGGVVVTHPHPLYGGSMHNNVVWTAVRAFGERGWASLRFNFRGVGASTGKYGGGLDEVEDLKAAVAYLQSRTEGPEYVVGYSFGAAVAARALQADLKVDGAVLISPPIAFMDLAFLPATPGLALIVVGDQDDLCPLEDLERLLRDRRPPAPLQVVAGADHFYGGREEALFQILRDYPLPGDSG